MAPPQVQFGHAGACANQASETAVAKNKALKEAGAFVPKSFDELGEVIKYVQKVYLFIFIFTFLPYFYLDMCVIQKYHWVTMVTDKSVKKLCILNVSNATLPPCG